MNNKNLVVIFSLLSIFFAIWLTFMHIDWVGQVQDSIQASGLWGYAIFVVAYAIATLLILPVTALNILGGALYGGWDGLLLTSAGALISALLGFVLARSLGNRLITIGDSTSTVNKNLVNGGIGYAFVARLLPLIPYGVISIAAGFSPINRRDYLLGTLLGTPLGIAPFVFLGSTGVQMSSNHNLLSLLASGMGIAMLIAVGKWYSKISMDKLGDDA